MDSTIVAALIGLIGVVGAAIPGYFALRATRRLRAERGNIDQQKVNQEQFDRFTAALERRMSEADHEVANLQEQQRTSNRLLRVAVHHIDELRVWSRAHVRTQVAMPPLPPELASLPLVWTEPRVNGNGAP